MVLLLDTVLAWIACTKIGLDDPQTLRGVGSQGTPDTVYASRSERPYPDG